VTDSKPKTVTLTHPDSEQSIQVNADDADKYLTQGWVDKSANSTTK
jgi:P pilus assembly chaperone PapD